VADKQSFGLINLRGTTTDELRRELQLQLQHIATRLDELAGTRGTPTFYGNVNANGKRFTNAGTPVNAQDLQRVDCCLHREDNNPTRDFDADFRRILNLEAAEFLTQAVNLDQLRRELSVGLTGATAQNAPPEVETASAIGSIIQRYAREDHTHSGVNLSDAQTVGGLKSLIAVDFTEQSSNPGDTETLYMDDGSNYIAGSLVWAQRFVVTEEMTVGPPGSEQDVYPLNGSSLDAMAKFNIYSADQEINIVAHTHSTAHPPQLGFLRAHTDTTSHSGGTVLDDDVLGQIAFGGYDGTDYAAGAYIRAEVDGTPGDDDMPTRLTFWTSADGSQSPAHVLTLDSSQTVFLGASDPGGNGVLRVNGALTVNTATGIIQTQTSFTDHSGAGAGTLTNAPSAGDPSKWILIDDAGTSRYIPAWT
jgi:hypothetical protein